MWATEWFMKWEIIQLEEENKKLKDNLEKSTRSIEHWRDLYWAECEKNKKLEEKIRFLEDCLDRKEKVNKELREEVVRFRELWNVE